MTTEQSAPGVAYSAVAAILQRTQPWVKFFSILGFVSTGLMVLIGILVPLFGLPGRNPQTLVVAIVYPVLGILYIFPSLYLLRYAQRIRTFATSGAEHDLVSALDAQRAFWKFIGVLSLISISLTLLVVAVGISLGVLATLSAG